MSSTAIEPPTSNDGPTGSMDDAAIGTLCQQMKLDHRYDKNGQAIVVEQLKCTEDAESDKEYKIYALVSRRFFNEKRELTKLNLEIYSRPILRVLSEIVKYYPAHPQTFQEVMVIEAPYKILYHHWQELKDYRQKTEDDEMIMHLNFLLNFMDREFGELSMNIDKLTEIGYISFSLLWTIFRPGDLVMQLVEKHHQRLWRLIQSSYLDDSNGRYLSLQMTCSDYDGTKIGRHQTKLKIRSFEGQACLITTLAAYPLRFHEDPNHVIENLTERGRRYLDLQGFRVQRYEGQFLKMNERHMPRMFEDDKYIPYSIQGRIVVDMKTFVEENRSAEYEDVSDNDDTMDDNSSDDSSSASTPTTHSQILEGALKSNEKVQPPAHTIKVWEKDDPMLFPPFVYGYSLGIKCWGRFFIDQICEPQWNPELFNDLILPDTPKQVIRSLVTSHIFPKHGARDQQGTKGKGLVVLLQGTPGTGKTLTAEVAAEVTTRALLVLSSGELGENVAAISASLTKFLRYAAIWGAVILIDEADVFLEARMNGLSNRLEQNSLVAVFLRQLEYFQGIVFLTTNRGTSLDLAIKSRIHLFLRFLPPDLETQKTMWRLRLGKKDAAEQEFNVEKALKIVGKADMNGRQISNAVQTIWTLARDEKKKVSLEHFRMFMRVWDSFEHEKGEGRGRIGKGENARRRITGWLRKQIK